MVCTWYAFRLDPRRLSFGVPHGCRRDRMAQALSCLNHYTALFSPSMVQQAVSLIGVKAVSTFIHRWARTAPTRTFAGQMRRAALGVGNKPDAARFIHVRTPVFSGKRRLGQQYIMLKRKYVVAHNRAYCQHYSSNTFCVCESRHPSPALRFDMIQSGRPCATLCCANRVPCGQRACRSE